MTKDQKSVNGTIRKRTESVGPRQNVATKAKAKGKVAAPLKKVAEPKRPRGRPSLYTREIADEICRRMSKGETVRSIGRDPAMPEENTIRGWALDDKDGFFAQYTRAVQIRAGVWAEEIIEISDDGSQDTYIDPATGNERTNAEVVARSRLRVDTRKWMLSKVLPKIYGEKLDLNHGVQPENPLANLLQNLGGNVIGKTNGRR